ncbi:thiamine pyrophosphate-binding protein [Candidatus Nephthysia bennettiae]|uniref:Thiamine pyrophosphate-binding protein n=1 Tax=Candidatus Nephthysia bennettiae TaxID=3127016 RepID=A0A934KBS0_9BACT|nr:thiamine pyrophosphate-binding protein [Candidatus Dormibacteraeota bacterium]MBJ7614031.1 thiamine pyrophosphate-binding protein [Candidatus Dormibacteraeota bacterium]
MNERIADELVRQRVEAVFTLMSEDTARLIVEIDRRGIPLYSTRHDSTAVGMADGYARTSGKVGVAVVGRGPGLTNAMNALVTAAKAGTGVVVLIGDTPIGIEDEARSRAARSERVGKHIDQDALLRAAGVAPVTFRSPATAVSDLAGCFDRAQRGGLVAVNLPTDLLEALTDPPGDLPPVGSAEPPAVPDSDAISLVADLIGESWAASRPVILAGYGAVTSGAGDDLRRLGQLTGSLMATTLMANSLFRSDEFDIGIVGTMSTPLGSELVSQADLVLAFGASLNPYTTYRGDLLRKARIVQFDSDPAAAGRYLPAELSVVGDARLAARALADELERRGHRGAGYRSAEIAKRIREFRLKDSVSDRSRPGRLDPRAVMIELDRVLPAERTLVIDGGHHFEFAVAHLAVPDPRAFILANEYFSVGCGLAAALGAAVARPDRLTVLEIGDGGMMMNLGDLDTAVRYRLPLVVVVTDDGGFGSEIHYLQVNGLPDDTARYVNPSFAAIAEGMGGTGVAVVSLDRLRELPAALEGLAGPLLLDCKVSSEVRAGWVDFLFTTGAAAAQKG